MKKILVVDDEEKITRLYKGLLGQEGYDAIVAPDAHWAVNLLVTQRDIDLILLDIRMPCIDGVTLNEAALQYDPDIKVIVTSAYPVNEQRRLIRRADDYYEKSQDLEVLVSKVRQVLRRENGHPSSLLEAFTERDNYLATPLHRAFVDRRKGIHARES